MRGVLRVSAREHLDQIDALVTPSDNLPWIVAVRDDDEDERVVLDSRLLEVAEVGAADAALVVAAVNSLPKHTAALRALLDVADLLDANDCGTTATVIRAVIGGATQ